MQKITERMQALAARHHAEDGATAVEYGLMVALIAAAIVAAVTTLGSTLHSSFEHVTELMP